jgi:PKD repeat protein
VPASLQYNSVQQPTPADLQLVQLQQRAALDIANLIGLDPEDLGVSTTSRTYQNATDRRQDKINDVLAAYMRAVTDRLSMNDVTKRGFSVAFDLDNYMKADPLTRWSTTRRPADSRRITTDEIRQEEGMPALPPGEAPQPAPTVAPQEATPVQNSAPVAATFSSEFTTQQTISFSTEDFAADAAKRTVSGVLIPFGAVGKNGQGNWRFAPGSIEWQTSAVSKVKLNREHDRKSLLGAATTLKASDSGITAQFKVGRGPLADQALSDAEDSILDGLSAEVDILDYTKTRPTLPSSL